MHGRESHGPKKTRRRLPTSPPQRRAHPRAAGAQTATSFRVLTPSEPSAAARSVLQDVFGLPDFRAGQGEVVAAAESGADVLFVAPTGSGKSIAYWVPGIVAGDLTIVVSPLIALMVDQVARLRLLGLPSAFRPHPI